MEESEGVEMEFIGGSLGKKFSEESDMIGVGLRPREKYARRIFFKRFKGS